MGHKYGLVPTISMSEKREKEGLKVIEKFCRKKYATSVIDPVLLEDDNLDRISLQSSKSSSFLVPSSTLQNSSASSPLEDLIGINRWSRSTVKPQFHGRLGTLHKPLRRAETFSKHRESMRFDRETEKFRSYLWRITKYIYRRLHLKYFLLLILLFLYALLGGLIFNRIEAPAELVRINSEIAAQRTRHDIFIKSIQQLLLQHLNCTVVASYRSVTKPGLRLFDKDACTRELEEIFQSYDEIVDIDPKRTNHWTWDDYWNSVFYAATLFTTIGYGNISCHTQEGRIATIIYALFGVPFMLVVLNFLGKLLFKTVQRAWLFFLKQLRGRLHCLLRCLCFSRFRENKSFRRQSTVRSAKDDNSEDEDAALAEDQLFETFPLLLAICIIFAYIGICSFIFCLWEDWDYFTAFYFFFISLMTIGLGDEVPDHPHYACLFFVFFIVGLALVSMCVSIMQVRVENRYLAALQLIEAERCQQTMTQPLMLSKDAVFAISSAFGAGMASKFAATDRPPIDSQGPFPHRASTIRWRDKPVSGGGDDAAVAEQRRQSRLSSVSSSSSMRAIPSPVLGVFMARNCSLRRSKRSESYRSNKSQPFSDEDKVQMEKARVSKDNSCFVPESEAQTKESGGNVSSAPVGIRPSLSVIDEMADENRRENSPSKSVTTSTDSSDAYESVCSEATSPQRVDHRSTASDENNENIVISL